MMKNVFVLKNICCFEEVEDEEYCNEDVNIRILM